MRNRLQASNIKVVTITLVIVAVMLLVTQACQPSAYAGELELGAMLKYGESRTATGLLHIEHRAGPATLNLDYSYGETDGEISTDKGSFNIGYDRDLADRWSLWLFNKAGFNRVRGIEVEDFLGFGPKYYIVKDSSMKLSLSAGYLLQYTEYDTGINESTHRMSYRLKGSKSYGNSIASAGFFYQPGVGDPNDYITIAKASYEVAITNTQGLKVGGEDEYRSIAEGARHEGLVYISFTVRWE
jgi:hypothetical protein